MMMMTTDDDDDGRRATGDDGRLLFIDNASSEIKLICKKYSANMNSIYTCIRHAAFGT